MLRDSRNGFGVKLTKHLKTGTGLLTCYVSGQNPPGASSGVPGVKECRRGIPLAGFSNANYSITKEELYIYKEI